MQWSKPWSKNSAYVVGGVFSALLACGNGEIHDHDNLREDVIYCEEAVSALSECCPGFKDSHAISCQYSYDYYPAGDCGGSSTTQSTLPDLTLAQSQCILSTTCEGLIARSVCKYVAADQKAMVCQ